MINPIFSGLLLLIGTAQIVVAADKARPAPFKSSATQSAQETGAVDIESAPPRSTPAPPAKIGNPKQMRLFHEVLNDILTEFAYDVKAKNLDVVKNIAIRKITVNEALPKSYENYLELMIIERLRSQAKMKLISCLPCKTKSTRVVEDRLFITSPTSNLEEMARASDELGIDNFMDVLFIYNSSHIVMAVQVFNSKSKEIIWAETYNSETLRSRYQKLAIDYNQIQQSRISDEYRPDFRYLIGLGAGNIPNVSKSALEKNMLSLHLRATEKFANRHNEFGLLLTLNLSSSSFLSTYPAEGIATTEDDSDLVYDRRAIPFTKAVGIFGLYALNFIGNLESYDEIRYGMTAAVGAHLATGYLAPTVRLGLDTYFGRRFAVSFSLIMVGEANILFDGAYVSIPPDVGADLILSYNI